jgi:hypothetical protein
VLRRPLGRTPSAPKAASLAHPSPCGQGHAASASGPRLEAWDRYLFV